VIEISLFPLGSGLTVAELQAVKKMAVKKRASKFCICLFIFLSPFVYFESIGLFILKVGRTLRNRDALREKALTGQFCGKRGEGKRREKKG